MYRRDEPSATDDVSLNDTYRVLSHPHRKHIVDFLDSHGSVSLPDLAEYLACCEHQEPLDEIPEDDVLSIYISLWHNHIPKMADAGLIRYDQEEDMVSIVSKELPPPGSEAPALQ